MSKLTDLGVAELRDGFRGGNFTAREVAEAFNAVVAGASALNAFITTTPEHALAAADEADNARAAGGDLKPLAGIPIGMKDLFATRGTRTTAGSHILEGFTPPYESTVSGKLWDAGAGMLGKLNMDQFAMGSSNETSSFGPVISPWRARHESGERSNTDLVPGGSSGGTSAAIAARLCPAATG
ncbi:MAG: Asp-tRNA(Asn)/Glu-tRNA(Gln) amidotransferase subunit GatA, partial [Alphaproteobacteria bacterium]|nr:Asp-tRNA(Asn)/Glu-tRNA(Gln) amidotransferase subunit GatA [Alphaproteobacteria bacterium]